MGDPGSVKQGVSSYHVGVAPFDECDEFVQSSKVLAHALAQSVELLCEVGPRCDLVWWFVQLCFLGTGVRGGQFDHICSTVLGGFHTLCLAKRYQF